MVWHSRRFTPTLRDDSDVASKDTCLQLFTRTTYETCSQFKTYQPPRSLSKTQWKFSAFSPCCASVGWWDWFVSSRPGNMLHTVVVLFLNYFDLFRHSQPQRIRKSTVGSCLLAMLAQPGLQTEVHGWVAAYGNWKQLDHLNVFWIYIYSYIYIHWIYQINAVGCTTKDIPGWQQRHGQMRSRSLTSAWESIAPSYQTCSFPSHDHLTQKDYPGKIILTFRRSEVWSLNQFM